MTRKSHVPLRTCIGCGGRQEQTGLLRVITPAGQGLQLALQRPARGRSGYLHRRSECWERFAARKGMVRSLGRQIEKTERLAFVQVLKQSEATVG